MMPGETHSAAPGTAADLAQCPGCASLQQNLNEYVEALITLKQKIINTDNLLTEYQKKCDELQFARRENSTLHHQVEQMLQKISPLQKCQEELGALKAELEEKKSSLKLYQASHQEYARVKEECLRSDAQKKKLEAKVKKLEEAALKQTQDFKQLKNEKKILEREFKKTQERLVEFSTQKNAKGLRHIGTQISSDSYGGIDKSSLFAALGIRNKQGSWSGHLSKGEYSLEALEKVKLLLKELWLCVNTAHRLPRDASRHTPEKSAQDDSSFTSREDGTESPSQGSPSRASTAQACLAELAMEVEESFAPRGSVHRERPLGAALSRDPAPHEDRGPAVVMQNPDESKTVSSDQAPCFDEDLQAAIDFFRFPLPLVSPVPSPPLTSSPNHQRPFPSLLAPETYFGEYTDSSDNEAPHEDSAGSATEDDMAEAQACFGLSRKSKGSGAWKGTPKSKEAVQARNRCTVNEVRTVVGETSAPLGVPSGFTEAERSPERSQSAPAERVLPGPSRSLVGEDLSDSRSAGNGATASKPGLYFRPLGKRPLNELMDSEEKASSSKKIGSPLSGFTKGSFADEIAFRSDCATGFASFPNTPRETAKEGEDELESTSESSDSEDDDPGDGFGPGGLDVGGTTSSSASAPGCSFSHPQPSKLEYINDADRPSRAMPTEQNRSPPQSEPPEPSVQRNSLHPLNPGWEALTLRSPRSRQTGVKTVEDRLRISVSQPLRRMTGDGQGGSRDTEAASPLPSPSPSPSPSSSGSQSGSSESDSDADKSTLWHYGDLVRRGGEGTPSVPLEHAHDSTHQLEKAGPALQDRGSSATLELAKEHTSPSSLLLSPVPVIPEQAGPEQGQNDSAGSGPREKKKLTSASENNDNETDHVSAAKDADSGPQEHKLTSASENCHNKADHVSAAKDADSEPQEHKLSLTSENCDNRADHVSAAKDADSGPQEHKLSLTSENRGSEMDHVSATKDADSGPQAHESTLPSENCDSEMDHVSAAEDGDSELQEHKLTSASENCDNRADHVSAAEDGDSEPQADESTSASENCDSEMDHVSAAKDGDSEPQEHELTLTSENCDSEMDHVSAAEDADSEPHAHESTSASENWDNEMDPVSTAKGVDSGPQAHELTLTSENCDSEMDHVSAAEDADSEPQAHESTSASENCDSEMDHISAAKDADSEPQELKSTSASENWDNETDPVSTAKGVDSGPQAHELTLTSENYSNEMDHLSTAKGAGEGGGATGNTEEEPAERSTFPELSLSCSTQDFGSQDISLPAENGDGCTGRKLSFSSEDNLCQSQDSSKEAAVLEEGPSGEAQQTSSGTENSEPPTEPAVSGGHPEEEVPCGRADRPDIDALAFANGSATQQSSSELSRLTSPAPRASPQPFLAAGTTLPSSPFRTDERAQEIPISSLPGTSSEAGKDTGAEESKPFSCSEGEQEAGTAVGSGSRGTLGERMAVAAEDRPSVDVGFLTLALQDFNISALPDRDGISASEVAVFLEGCQLKDCSSGDSVPECSSSGTLNKDVSQELVQSGISEETQERQLCAEETPDNIQEWIESEEETSSGNASQLVRSSLETMSEVLSKIGQELQTNCGHRAEEDTGSLSLLSETSSTATGAVRESSAPAGASSSAPHSPEQPPPLTEEECADGRSPARGLSQGGLAVDPAAACVDTGKDGLAGPVGSSALTSDSAAESRMEQSSGDESETFQSHMSALASEVPGTYPEKGHAVGVEKETGWTVSPDTAHSPEEEGEGDSVCMTSTEIAPDSSHAAPPSQEPLSDGAFPGAQGDVSCNGQSANFDKSRLRNRPVKPSIWISSQMYDQTFEAQNVASDHTYYNSKLEPLGKNKTPRSKISNKEQSNKPVKTSLSKEEFPHSHLPQPLSGESGPESQKGQTPPILVQADPSVSTDGALDALSKIRQEVGPPLPPLLAPLIATPPRAVPPLSPLPCSPSPACDTPGPPVLSPRPEDPPSSSPSEPSPSPFSAAGGRILSSPLQFCAATPKHALPVPGRLPPCAPGPAAVGGPQENSVKILDTMYPELSARARTLSILKGNMQLSGGTSADGRALPGRVSALLGLKAITSTTTAFVKTGSGSGVSGSQGRSRDVGTHQAPSGKRALPTPAPRSAKRLRLDGESPEPEPRGASGAVERPLPAEPTAEQGSSPVPQLPAGPKETVESHDQAVVHALKKVAESTFDLLPVIRSHVYVGNISKKPVMRDQEKEVVYEFSTTKKHLAECLLRSILAELKLQRKSVDHSYIHALCRVYVGICRQLGDLERARLFCYSLLKEDFPESEKLALFIANMWDDVFVSQSVISKAMQLVARQRAKGEVLNCLRAFLNWEKSAPVDVGIMVSKLLLTIQLCPKTEFQASEKYGEDLSGHTWEYIFAIDLLCCHQKWIWTHDNIISKELWPVMDKWIKYRKGHSNITFTPDVIIASVLRLIGRLGQLGLKEGFPTAVKNISSVIGTFIQHAQDEDIPWGVQLAAVYALCDLSPSNPAEIAQVLEDWRRRAPNSVPSAILAYLEEVGALSEAGGPRAPAL